MTPKIFYCSFCHASQHHVDLMIAGDKESDQSVNICSECLALCNDIVAKKSENEEFAPIVVSDEIVADFETIEKLKINALRMIGDCYAGAMGLWEKIEKEYNIDCTDRMYNPDTKMIEKSVRRQEANDWFYSNYMVIKGKK